MACASTVTRRSATSTVLGAAIALLSTATGCRTDSDRFPFNHRAHVAGGVDCLQCHEGVLDAEKARFPVIASCAACHRSRKAGSPEEERLADLDRAGGDLGEAPPRRLPDHVFFSHARHVDVAGLECVDCHASVASSTRPLEGGTLTMTQCMKCHADHSEKPAARRAALDCAACHR